MSSSISGILEGYFGQLLNTIFSSIALVIVVIVLILAAYYALTGFKWLHIGRKAGLEKDWMPFVPFAKTIYRLQIVDEQWWKMFLLEFWWLWSLILYNVIRAISDGHWTTFAWILVGTLCACCLAYNVFWRYKYYKAFAIQPILSISILIPFTGGMRRVIDYQVGFTENFDFTGEGLKRTIKGTAQNVVDVPRGGQAGQRAMAGGMGSSITGLSGMYAGTDLPLANNDEMVIGRDNAMCNLIIDQNAQKVSRRHCGVIFDAGRGVYQVTDYSTNGTFVEGGNRLVANMPTSLPRGTIIALGNRENRFKLN